MKNVYNILWNLNQLESPSQKIVALYSAFDDKEFYDFLKFFYISEKFNVGNKVIEKALNFDNSFKYSDVGELAFKCINKEVFHFQNIAQFNLAICEIKTLSGKDLIKYLHDLFEFLSKHEAKILANFLAGDLKLGLSLKSINKILIAKNLEPYELFEVMLCEKMNETEFGEINFPIEVNVKYDGLRIVAIKDGNSIILKTRAGKIANEFLPEIVEHLKQIEFDCILDGEVIGADFNEIQKRIGRKEENVNDNTFVQYQIFDILSKDGNDLTKLPRKNRLDILNNSDVYTDHSTIAENYIVSNLIELNDIYNDVTRKRKLEGIILKDLQSTYEYGSRKGWWKVKPFQENTFKVVGYEYGNGKNCNSVGSILIEDKSGKIKSKVGSGISDSYREYFDKHFLIDKNQAVLFVDVKYQEVTKNKNGFSLRFPSLLCARYDKNEADQINLP